MAAGRYMVQHWPCEGKALQTSKVFRSLVQARAALERRHDGHRWIVWGQVEHYIVATRGSCTEQ